MELEKPLWKPSKHRVENSNENAFIKHVQSKFDASVNDHWTLYDWSIKENETFWLELIEYFDVKGKFKGNILKNKNNIEKSTWFEESSLNFAENLLRFKSDKVALTEIDHQGNKESITYAQLSEKVDSLATYFKVHCQIESGDVIAGILTNSIASVVCNLATLKLGAIWTSCSTDFGTEAILERFQQVSPKLLCTTLSLVSNKKTVEHRNKITEITQNLNSVRFLINCAEDDGKVFQQENIDVANLESAINGAAMSKEHIDYERFPFNHPAYILYSSGTTGAPKCIVHGAGGTLLQHVKELSLHTGVSEGDTIFYYTSCGWMMWNWLISALYLGAHIVLYDGSLLFPHPNRLFEISKELKVNVLGLSPRYLQACEKVGVSYSTEELPKLRTILSTGSVLTPYLYDYIYQNIKQDVLVSSISGGTDIVSCFIVGCELIPVYKGEAQTPGLGLDIQALNEQGERIVGEQGELVCVNSFVSKPIYFWNDELGERYHNAYFSHYKGKWTHGDFISVTENRGITIHGRSDATLNPGGVRVGSAEIYRQIFSFQEVKDAVAISHDFSGQTEIVLFVQLEENVEWSNHLMKSFKQKIRINLSENHVPKMIVLAPDLPRTYSGKTVELAIKNILDNVPVKNTKALINPESLTFFRELSLT